MTTCIIFFKNSINHVIYNERDAVFVRFAGRHHGKQRRVDRHHVGCYYVLLRWHCGCGVHHPWMHPDHDRAIHVLPLRVAGRDYALINDNMCHMQMQRPDQQMYCRNRKNGPAPNVKNHHQPYPFVPRAHSTTSPDCLLESRAVAGARCESCPA